MAVLIRGGLFVCKRNAYIYAETNDGFSAMPFTRLALLLCYVVVAAGLTVFLFAQIQSDGNVQSLVAMLLPLAMIAGLLIRSLQKRLNRDADD